MQRFLPVLGSSGLLVLLVGSILVLKDQSSQALPSMLPDRGASEQVSPLAIETTGGIPSAQPPAFYAPITDRPLFALSRRPVQVGVPITESDPVASSQPEPIASPSSEPAPDFRLQGTLATGGGLSALIAVGSEPAIWVAKGDTVLDWTLADIGSDWAELSHNTETVRVELYPQ